MRVFPVLRGLFASVFLLVLILFDNAANKMPSRQEVIEYVRENETVLIQCIAAGDYASLGAPVEEVTEGDRCIEFSCGGSGFGPETAYCGFFYSPDDDMSAVWCAPQEALTPTGNGFGWQEADGDNACYIEPIVGHFYYYEAAY